MELLFVGNWPACSSRFGGMQLSFEARLNSTVGFLGVKDEITTQKRLAMTKGKCRIGNPREKNPRAGELISAYEKRDRHGRCAPSR